MDIKEIPLEDLLEPEVPVRSISSESKMEELVLSVGQVDLLQPLVVRPDGDKYRIIAGHRRFIALRALDRETAPCNVVEVGPGEAAMMSLAENLAREDIDPIDEAKFFQYLISNLGLTHQEIADKIGRQRTYVTHRLRLLKLDEETKADITYHNLPPSTALELSRIPDKSQRDYYRTMAVKHGAATHVVHDWVEDVLTRGQNANAGEAAVDPGQYKPQSTYPEPRCICCGAPMSQRILDYVPMCRADQAALQQATEALE